MSYFFACCSGGPDWNPVVRFILWIPSLLFHFPLFGMAVTIAGAMYAIYLFMEA